MKAKGRKTSLLIFSIQYIFQKFGSTPSTDMHHLASYICAFIILKVLLISKLIQLQSNIGLMSWILLEIRIFHAKVL